MYTASADLMATHPATSDLMLLRHTAHPHIRLLKKSDITQAEATKHIARPRNSTLPWSDACDLPTDTVQLRIESLEEGAAAQ